MSDFQPAETLRQHRPLLLALETIGWLHMTGKAKADFLCSHGGQDNYDYKKWHEQEAPPFPWDDLLKWVQDDFDIKTEFSLGNDHWPGTLTEFLTKHKKRDSGLLGLLQAGHAMASGIEKQSYPQNTVKYLGQDATHMWLSTAFGQPVRNLLADTPELLTEAGWKRLLGQIEGLLTELKRLGDQGSSNDLDAWWQWRDCAVGPDGWLREAFTSTLAETRLPNNDVTLFDQSYVAAALFKSTAAGALLEGKSFPWDSSSLKQQTRWRLLTIGIGADHFESRAVKIGDWTGARLALDEFFRKACRLVEVDLAVGSLLYADGEVCVFSFPGERFGHNKQGYQGGDLKIDDWKNWLIEKIDSYAREAELETPPYCSISEPFRSLVGMTEEIRTAKYTMAVPLFRDWKISDHDSSNGHVCPVCLVRRSGDKSSKQTPCKTCRVRRTGRLDAWLGREFEFETDSIWISELADVNDRVALITISLDIDPWLDGTRLDALRAQSVKEWAAQNKTKKKPLPGNYGSLVDLVKTALGKGNQASQARSLIRKKIAPGLKDENNNDPWNRFYELMVEDRAKPPKPPKWDDLDVNGRARWLVHQLFRKLASPGRIYRFQRQAEDFFKVLLAEFREIAATDRNRWRVRRLVIKSADGSSGSWEGHQPYNGRYGDAPGSLLYREETKDFLTICNLARLLKPEQDKESLKDSLGGTLELKADDSEYKKKTEKLNVKSVSDDAGELGCYHPVIPLELSPVRFRILVPLEAASKCVDYAIGAWNEQFARVWDRLPLRIGVVAFRRMTPFQAVIEAARNIEADLTKSSKTYETWRVEHRETREGVVALSLVCPDGQRELRTMPVKLPDGREDVFYPYLAVEDKKVRFPLDFQHPEGQTYRHAKDLRIGDGVLVYPSYIDTVFLDSTARRFEPLSPRQLMQWRRMRDLWKLIDRNVPSQTALRGAWSELVERHEAWQGPDLPAAPACTALYADRSAVQAGGTWLEGGKDAWLDLVRAVFHKRLGVRGACLETLVEAAGDGILDWCLEWHISILKKQVSGGDR